MVPSPLDCRSFGVLAQDHFEPEVMRAVLRGSKTGVVFRGFLEAGVERRLYESFRAAEGLRRREGDATGSYLGSFHWGKSLDTYSRDCLRVKPSLESFLALPEAGAWRDAVAQLAEVLEANGELLRAAVLNAQEVALPLIREWEGQGDYSLVPHDDLAQCSDPDQAGFEVQEVSASRACSINLCIANAGGGELEMWDYRPSQSDRARLGTSVEGGPYELADLAPFTRSTTEIRPGDLYMFDGSYVHAVGATAGPRATISCLVGYINDREAVMWS